MKRRTHFFPDAQLKKLAKVSRKTGLAVADIIRRAIDYYLEENYPPRQC
jgi:predicted DNA-binding protein